MPPQKLDPTKSGDGRYTFSKELPKNVNTAAAAKDYNPLGRKPLASLTSIIETSLSSEREISRKADASHVNSSGDAKEKIGKPTARKTTGGKPPKSFRSIQANYGVTNTVEAPPSRTPMAVDYESLFQDEALDDSEGEERERQRLLDQLLNLNKQKIAKNQRKREGLGREAEASSSRLRDEWDINSQEGRADHDSEDELSLLANDDDKGAMGRTSILSRRKSQLESQAPSDDGYGSYTVEHVMEGDRVVPWGFRNSCRLCRNAGSLCVPAKNKNSLKCASCDRKTLICGPWKLVSRGKMSKNADLSSSDDELDELTQREDNKPTLANAKPWSAENPCPQCKNAGRQCEAQSPLKNRPNATVKRACGRCARKRIKCGPAQKERPQVPGDRDVQLPISQEQGGQIIGLLEKILGALEGGRVENGDSVERPRKRAKVE